MILDIDVGNTRLKWVTRSANRQVVQRGVFGRDQLLGEQFDDLLGDISRVRISSVRGDVNDRMADYFRTSVGIVPEFASVIDGESGLRCGYSEPNKLGVDRWLACVACWATLYRNALVVDAGSALTIDILDGERHHGGYILPGIGLMTNALGVGTWGVRTKVLTYTGITPGVDTTSAVNNGCLLAAVAIVEKVARQWAPAAVVLTGGDGDKLKDHLSADWNVIEVSDLVLDGLAVALP